MALPGNMRRIFPKAVHICRIDRIPGTFRTLDVVTFGRPEDFQDCTNSLCHSVSAEMRLIVLPRDDPNSILHFIAKRRDVLIDDLWIRIGNMATSVNGARFAGCAPESDWARDRRF